MRVQYHDLRLRGLEARLLISVEITEISVKFIFTKISVKFINPKMTRKSLFSDQNLFFYWNFMKFIFYWNFSEIEINNLAVQHPKLTCCRVQHPKLCLKNQWTSTLLVFWETPVDTSTYWYFNQNTCRFLKCTGTYWYLQDQSFACGDIRRNHYQCFTIYYVILLR